MASEAKPRVAVHLNADQDAVAWAHRHAQGLTLDRTPYGYERAASHFDLVWSRSYPETRIGRAIRRRLANWLGFDLLHAWRNRHTILDVDAVWTHTEREHLAVAALQVFRRPRSRVPVLAQSVWLWDAWSGYGPFRRRLVAMLLRIHPVEVVHSRLNLSDSLAAVPGRRVLLVPFGSAVVDRPPNRSEQTGSRLLVLAVGNDRDRDWPLLAAVAGSIPGADFRVASSSQAARAQQWPANAFVGRVATMQELGELYARADVVALPLRPNRHASGTTACVEALSAGSRIVATDVGGLDDYLGGEGRLVEAGDVDAFAAAVRAGLRAEFPAAPPEIPAERGLTQEDYVRRYVMITRALLGLDGWNPAISRFIPMLAAQG